MDLSQKRTTEVPLVLREPVETDIPFIFNSWLKSFRHGTFNMLVDNSIYYSEQHKLIERLLKTCKVCLAVDAADISTILGYIVYENVEGIWAIHYIYTKHTFRGMGIARELLRHMGHDFKTLGAVTHLTRLVSRLAPKYNLIYHPYILLNYAK